MARCSRRGCRSQEVTSVPVLEAAVEAISQIAAEHAALPILRERPVLYIEDERPDRAAVEDALRRREIECVSGWGDREVLELAKARPPSLALVDYAGPGMDGLSQVRQVREALGRDVPAVGYSAYIADLAGWRALASERGVPVDGFVRKAPGADQELIRSMCYAIWSRYADAFERRVADVLASALPALSWEEGSDREAVRVDRLCNDKVTLLVPLRGWGEVVEVALPRDLLSEFCGDHPYLVKRPMVHGIEPVPIVGGGLLRIDQGGRGELDPLALADGLAAIPSGAESAHRYDHVILETLLAVFHPQLQTPVAEQPLHQGRKRIDVVFNNRAERGFFADLATRHRVPCPYVFVECKNYRGDPRNPEVDQITGRFSAKRGMFGFLICRKVTDRDAMRDRCRDVVSDDRGYVLVLDDADMVKLLRLRARGDAEAVDNYLRDRLRELLL